MAHTTKRPKFNIMPGGKVMSSPTQDRMTQSYAILESFQGGGGGTRGEDRGEKKGVTERTSFCFFLTQITEKCAERKSRRSNDEIKCSLVSRWIRRCV